MKTILHLVRHGEVFNPNQVVYGRLPGFVLSEKGREEAAALGDCLKTRPIAALYASPLTRAQETVSYIAKHFPNLPVVTDTRLIEVASPMDGKPNSLMYARNWNFYTKDLLEEGGESLQEIWQRMKSFWLDVARKHEGGEIVAVSHGDPIMVTHTKCMGNPLTVENMRKDYIPHASGFTFVVENDFVLHESAIRPLQNTP